jgi:hypothetical protein
MPIFPVLTAKSEAVGTTTIPFRVPIDRWTAVEEKRFLTLVKLEALNSISAQQSAELESLQSLRRNLHHPRTPEEIVWDYKNHQVTEKLLNALAAYVRFVQTESQS